VGRHTAPEGDAVHPVVAAALARRPVDAAGAHRGEQTSESAGPLGWPGEPPAPGGGGLGWPGDLTPTAPVERVTESAEAPGPAGSPVPPVDGGRRRGWRRFLGLDRAA
jgi:hypothetical protein